MGSNFMSNLSKTQLKLFKKKGLWGSSFFFPEQRFWCGMRHFRIVKSLWKTNPVLVNSSLHKEMKTWKKWRLSSYLIHIWWIWIIWPFLLFWPKIWAYGKLASLRKNYLTAQNWPHCVKLVLLPFFVLLVKYSCSTTESLTYLSESFHHFTKGRRWHKVNF